jgi:hypothetical protein
MAACLARALLFLVLVLPEVHDAADRRHGARRDLDEIEPFLARDHQRLLRRHDAELLAEIVNHPDLAHADTLVDARAVITTWAGAFEYDNSLLSL